MDLDWDKEEQPITYMLENIQDAFISVKQGRIDEYCDGNVFEYQKVIYVACKHDGLNETHKKFVQDYCLDKITKIKIVSQRESARQSLSDARSFSKFCFVAHRSYLSAGGLMRKRK